MKVCVLQLEYDSRYERSDDYFLQTMAFIDRCDASMDLIVLPEYSNLPCAAATEKEMIRSVEKYTEPLLKKCSETARKCRAVVCVCCIRKSNDGFRNTIFVFNQEGERVGQYDKQHLTPTETNVYKLDNSYTYDFSEPFVLEIEKIRYAFLICYDFYFYEMYSNLARFDPDIIISCSYQRSDLPQILELLSRFCAYHCGAYVVRSSVSLGSQAPTGGCSMVVSPRGDVLLNMGNDVGIGSVCFDVHKKYLKLAGYGNPPKPHHKYIEDGRKPWKYRPGGSAIVCDDFTMGYPRVCSQGGMTVKGKQNSLAAFGAAVAAGAQEISFQVVIRQGCLGVEETNAHGLSERKVSGFVNLEDIIKKFSCHVVMGVEFFFLNETKEERLSYFKKFVRLMKRYDCEKYCYVKSSDQGLLQTLCAMQPNINTCLCMLVEQLSDSLDLPCTIRKIQIDGRELQGYSDQQLRRIIELVHGLGKICAVNEVKTVKCQKRYLKANADVVVTQNFREVFVRKENISQTKMR